MTAPFHQTFIRLWRWACLIVVVTTSARAWIELDEGRRLTRQIVSAEAPATAFCTLPGGDVIIAADNLYIAHPPFLSTPRVFTGPASIRFVAPGGANRVWIAGGADLGQVDFGPTGEPRFTSLRDALPAPYREDRARLGAFIGIQSVGDGAFFLTEHALLLWDNGRFQVWPWGGTARALALRPQQWLVHVAGRGLLLPTREGPWPFADEATFPSPPLWLLPPDAANAAGGAIGEGWRHGTARDAFIHRDGTWRRLAALSDQLAETSAVTAQQLPDGGFAIATRNNGIILADTNGIPRGRIEEDALGTEFTAHALWLDASADLWVGTETGAVRITDPARFTYLAPTDGRGANQASGLAFAGGHTYAANNRGVFRLQPRTAADSHATLVQLPRAPGAVHALLGLGDRLIAAGDGGVWDWFNGSWRVLARMDGSASAVLASKVWPGRVYYAATSGIHALTFDGGPPMPAITLDTDALSLAEDARGDLWVATVDDRILQLRLSAGPPYRPVTFVAGNGLPAGIRKPRPRRFGDTMLVVADGAVLGFNEAGAAFEPIPAFANIRATPGEDVEGDQAIWVIGRTSPDAAGGQTVLARVERGVNHTWRWTPLVTGTPPGKVAHLLVDRDSMRVFAQTASSVLRYGPRSLDTAPQPGAARLTAIQVQRPVEPAQTDRPGSVNVALPLSGSASALASDTARVRFEFAGESGLDRWFQTRLDGLDSEWSPGGSSIARDYVGLAAGDYTFHVRVVDAVGRSGREASFHFVKAAPWYLRWPMWIAYALVAFAIGAAGMRWRLHRVERQNAALNRKVEERTRELELTNSAKMDFLASISHEIRNPLNGIVGLVALLNQAQLAPRERELAQSLAACARSLRRVFDEVLGFAKLESGRITLQDSAITLSTLLEDVAGVFAAEATLRGCRLSVVVDKAIPPLAGDVEKIHTILSNFVSNALKYAPGSAVEISGAVEPTADGRFIVNLQVRDQGPGIAPNEQEIIFRKFVRGSNAERRHEPGAGLGLATCEALARLMDGGVGVESEPGQGATFFLHVTLAPAPLSAQTPPGAIDPISAPAESPTGHTALVIEDQPYNQLVARNILERFHYTVALAANAETAHAQIARGGFALALVDWDVPGAKGDEMSVALRAAPGGSETIILAVTAHDAEEIRNRCFAAGMDGFLIKPLDEATLAQTLKAVRGKRSASHAPVPPPSADDLDFRIFSYLGRNNESKLREAAEEYLIQLNVEIDALAAASRDPAHMAACAHRLRGHASIVRCKALQEAARRLQERGTRHPGEPMEIALAEVVRAAGDLRAQLERFLAHRPATAD